MTKGLRVLLCTWNIPGLDNYMINLILVSAFSAVLILVIMALKPLLKSRYTIGLKQFLWIMLAIRLIIPFSYKDTFFTIQSAEYDTGAKVYISKSLADEETSNQVVAIAKESDTSQLVTVEEKNWQETARYYIVQGISFFDSHVEIIAAIYMSGVILFLAYQSFVMIYFKNKRKKARSKVENMVYLDIFQKAAQRIGVKKLPVLYEIEGLASPMATGFFKFQIYIPTENYSEKEFRAIVSHELTHIYHQDLRIKMLYLLANALHWFNPVVYLMLREAGRDMELYCDKSVVKMFDWEERQEYNQLLLSILKGHSKKDRQEYMTTCFKGGVKEMKERFLNNLDMGKKREGILPIVLAGGLIAISAGLFSIDSQAMEREEIKGVRTDSSPLQFVIGDTSSEEVPITKRENEYVIPVHYNDFNGNVYVERALVPAEREEWTTVPEMQVFCGTTPIEAYGVEVNSWKEGSIPKISHNPEFFRDQCMKGEKNPVFEVLSWKDAHVEDIRLIFPEGQVPDVVDVEDIVLNEDGSVRYEGSAAEVIYRQAEVMPSRNLAVFSLAQHYSIWANENPYNYELLTQPFYRGYKVRCYWGGKSQLQSCTYYIVLRTRSTIYDELVEAN